MKMLTRIIQVVSIFSLTACSTAFNATVNTYADISLMDYQGKVIQYYPNALLSSHYLLEDNSTMPIKDGGGLSFVDENGVKHYITGGIITADNIRRYIYSNAIAEPEEDTEKVKLVSEFERLSLQVQENEKTIKKLNPSSDLYAVKNEQSRLIRNRLSAIKKQLWNDYQHEVTMP